MIKKISIEHLIPGMYVADLNNQWVPSQNASRKGVIKLQSTVDKIKALGISQIYIDTNKGLDCGTYETADAAKQLQAEQFNSLSTQSGASGVKDKYTSRDKKREHAEKTFHQAKSMVNDVLDDVRNGKGLDIAVVDSTAEEMVLALNANESALLCMSHIRSKDEYLLEHSVNVGILMGVFCRAKRVPPELTQQLVAGALLHDIGKVLVPDEILHKPGKLEVSEWEEMKRHVTYGSQILEVTEGLSDVTRSICRLHHERLDGSGYPMNLKENEISQWGRMAAICDVYDAITADRVYHKGMAPNKALKKLVEWSVFHLDKELVYDFIRCLSAYPVGTLVELSNERAAVVIEANRRGPKQPRVRVFYNTRQQNQVEPYLLNLADKNINVDIISTLDARQLNIDIRPFL